MLSNYQISCSSELEQIFSDKYYSLLINKIELFKNLSKKSLENFLNIYKTLSYYNNLLEYKSRDNLGIHQHYPLLTEKQYRAKLAILNCLQKITPEYYCEKICSLDSVVKDNVLTLEEKQNIYRKFNVEIIIVLEREDIKKFLSQKLNIS